LIRKKQITVLILCIWLLIITIFMMAAQRFDLEIFYVLWLIGILIIVELTETRYFQTPYLKKIKIIIAVGIVIFGYIVVEKVLFILNS
jgi:hypothetical protein